MKKGRGKKHRICAAFLCVCVLLSLSGISDIFPVVAAAEQAESFQKENIVTTFDPLSEEVKTQTVFTGTDRDELNLPEELTAYLLWESSEQKMEESEQENTGKTDKIEENFDTETRDEQDTQSEETDETTGIDSEDTTDTENEEDGIGDSAPLEEQGGDVNEQENTPSEKQQEEAVTIDGVTWQSEPKYDGNTEGIYTFTAVLPEGYTLAEGISLPQITVTVRESESGTDFAIPTLLDRIAALPDAEEYLALEPDMEDEDVYAEWEEKLYEYAEEALAIWEEYETLTEEQQAQILEEELAKLAAWVELAGTLSDHAVMLADNSGHHGGAEWQMLTTTSNTTLSTGYYYLVADENAEPKNTIKMNTITIENGATVILCLNGCTLEHSGETGSVIVVGEGATFTLCDCQDYWDYTSSFDEGTITYSCGITGGGGRIIGGSGNNYQGGGVYVGSNATFNMNSGRITGCDVGTAAGHNGGGVAVIGGIFNMSGGYIDGNKACLGGGVYLTEKAIFHMSGNAVIMDNEGSGGGVYCLNSKQVTFTMDSGAIIGNRSGNSGMSGGVFLGATSTFNMNGGAIEGNCTTSRSSSSAAAIYSNNATINLAGDSSIRHNKAGDGVGGIRAILTSMISVSGNICIADNYGNGDGTESNVSLSNLPITVTGDLTNDIGVTYTPLSGTVVYPVKVVEGTDSYPISDADWSHFFSDNEELKIVKEGNELKLYPLSTCDLSGLDLTAEGAKLEPNFQAGITTYEATVGNEVDTIGITATLSGSINGRKIELKNGDDSQTITMTSGEKKNVPLAVGLNKIEITVIFESDTKTYTLNITRDVPAGNLVTITTYKDSLRWTENSPTYKLIPENGTIPVTDLTAVPDGTYHIYYDYGSDKGIDTGVDVKVEGAATTATVNYYTVTFYDGDTKLTQQIVPEDATASAPTDNPTKTGYTFSNWVMADGDSTEYGFNEAVTRKTSVYASWTPIKYTISYNLAGGTLPTGKTNPENYTIETADFTLQNPADRIGYTFTGWSGTGLDANTLTVSIPQGSIGNRAYTANWEPKNYNVTLYPNGGGTGTNLNSYTFGKGATLPTGWTRTGYDFAGWYDNKDCTGTAITEIPATATGNKEYWANWTPISYSISYELNGGTATGNPTTYTIESNAITLVNPSKTGYSFAGWSGTGLTGSNHMSVTIAAGSTGDREYTAHWTAAGYTVTLNGGGTGTALTGYTYGIGATLPTDWTKTGYTFAGWYAYENYGGDPVTKISATDTGDKTFWAKWTPKTYQVTFDNHGADGGNTIQSKDVTYADKYGALPVPFKTGYTFKGWYTEENGQGSKVDAGTTVTTASAHTLHAYWKDETPPDQPVLQDGVTLPEPEVWTNNQTTIPLKLYDGVGVTKLLVSVDGNPYVEVSGFSGGTGSVNYSYTDVQEGEHKYQFKAVDAAGNFAESDIFTVKLDQTKPVISTLTYENKAANLWQWIIGKKSMIIHVPVTDTGSGVERISYTMTPRDAAGNSDSSNAVEKTAAVKDGEAKITFADNFRGTIAISCTDAAGNAADGITVGKDAGGVIVEDQAPDITVLADRNISDTKRTQPDGVDVSEAYYNSAPSLFVTVKDDTGNAIATGIATVTYQVWNGEVKPVSVNMGLQAEVSFEIPSAEIPTGSTKITIKTADNAGNPAQKLITIKVKGPEKQPDAEIDYRQEELTGFLPDGEYLIEGNLYKADQEGHIPIREDWLGSSISIVKKGNGSETSDSPAQNLSVPTRPQKPTPAGVDVSIAGGTGKLTGLTAGTVYEVSTDGGKTWVSQTADGDGAITGLAPGTYVVRVKAGASSFASEKSEPAAIGAYQIKVTFMVDGAKYKEIFVDYGAALTDIPPVPAKENVVGAWCMDEQGTTPAVFTNVTADMTVYAVYTAFYTVTLQGGEGYVLSAENGSTSPVKEGGSFTFRFALREGYEKGTDFAVRINGAKVELSNDTYTIADIRESQVVTVEGVAKKPGGGSSDLPGGGGGNGNDEPQPTLPPSESTDDTPSTPPEKPPVKPTPTEPETPPPPEEKEPEGRKPDITPEPEETPGPQEPKSNETQPPTDTPAPPADVTQPTAAPETTLPAAGSEPESGKPDSTPEPEAASGPQKPIDSETQPQMPDTTPASLTYQVGKGAVIVTLNNVDETVCAAKVTDASAVAQAVLSEEELAEVKQGQTIEIRIDVEHLETVPEEDAGVIDEGIEDCREQLSGLVMGMYVDISMYMRVGGGDWNAIRATNEPVEIVLDVPDELAELTADFYIMRAHEGEYLLMEDLDDVPETITIQTEAFSTYAILYRLQGSGGTTPAAKCSLCHICPTFLGICYFVWLAILILLILLAWIILHKRKEEQQQEDKE